MTATGVDFFYGPGSRYSYLAATQLERIEEETGCRFVWRPLSSADLMAACGRNPFQDPPASGQYDWAYRQRDAEAWAAHYRVPYREPERLEVDPRLLAEACIAAGRLGRLVEYSRALFAAIFVHGQAIDAAGLDRLAIGLGLPEADFRTLRGDPATIAAQLDTVREAHRRGAFGVPTFFVGERMFWGNDRLVLLEDLLHGAG